MPDEFKITAPVTPLCDVILLMVSSTSDCQRVVNLARQRRQTIYGLQE